MGFKKGTTVYEPPQRPFVDCSVVGCAHEAIVSSKGSNLCIAHYQTRGQEQAWAYAKQHKLLTPRDHIAHQRKLLATPKDYRAWMKNPKSALAKRYADEVRRRDSILEREPGQDDEELLELRKREGVEA